MLKGQTSNHIICIPSKNRLEWITAHKFFENYKIFVEPQDYEKYVQKFGDKVVNIWQNDKWFWYVLNFMAKYVQEQWKKYMFFVDDDIFGFRVRTEWVKTKKLEWPLDSIVQEFVNICEEKWLSQLWLSFTWHNRMKKQIFTKNVASWGCHCTNVDDFLAVWWVPEYPPIYSDYIISFNLILSWYRTGGYYKYCFDHIMASKEWWAATLYRDKEKFKEYTKAVQQMYWDYVRLVEKHGQLEIRFKFSLFK